MGNTKFVEKLVGFTVSPGSEVFGGIKNIKREGAIYAAREILYRFFDGSCYTTYSSSLLNEASRIHFNRSDRIRDSKPKYGIDTRVLNYLNEVFGKIKLDAIHDVDNNKIADFNQYLGRCIDSNDVVDCKTLEILLDEYTPLPHMSSLSESEITIARPLDYLIRCSEVNEKNIPKDYLKAFNNLRKIKLDTIKISRDRFLVLSSALNLLHPDVSRIYSISGDGSFDFFQDELAATKIGPSNLSKDGFRKLVESYNLLTGQQVDTSNLEKLNSEGNDFMMCLTIRTIIAELFRHRTETDNLDWNRILVLQD